MSEENSLKKIYKKLAIRYFRPIRGSWALDLLDLGMMTGKSKRKIKNFIQKKKKFCNQIFFWLESFFNDKVYNSSSAKSLNLNENRSCTISWIFVLLKKFEEIFFSRDFSEENIIWNFTNFFLNTLYKSLSHYFCLINNCLHNVF